MPFFDVSTSGQDTQRQLKVFLRSFAGTLVLRFYEHRRTRIACAFHAVCFGNYTFFRGRVDCHRLRRSQCDRFPPSLLKAFCVAPLLSCQCPETSQTRERMGTTLRLATRQHPPNAGPDVYPRDFSCYGALDGLGRLASLEGEAFPQAVGLDSARLVFRTRRRLGHRGLRFRRAGQRLQSRYGVYLGTAPRHIWVQSLSGRACCAMGVGLLLRPSQLCSLLSCYQALAQGVVERPPRNPRPSSGQSP